MQEGKSRVGINLAVFRFCTMFLGKKYIDFRISVKQFLRRSKILIKFAVYDERLVPNSSIEKRTSCFCMQWGK